MESLPLLPKAKILQDLDAAPIIREFFQEELESALCETSSKKLAQTVLTSLRYEKQENKSDSKKTIESQDNSFCERENLLRFSKSVFQAFREHEQESQDIRKAEKNIFENQTQYLKREAFLLENKTFQELYLLKRQPHLKALDASHVTKYKLLEEEACLPPIYQAHSDFRVQHFGKWRKRLESLSQDSIIMNHLKHDEIISMVKSVSKNYICVKSMKPEKSFPKIQKSRSRVIKTVNKKGTEIFQAEPKIVFFTGYKPGEIYTAGINVKNIYTKGMLFQVKPMSPSGPFHVSLSGPITSRKLFPGLSFQLAVEFSPKSLDVIAEDIYIAIEEGKKLLIPLVAYLEPPILKTHKDINEFTKVTTEKIASSFIECGTCFTGDTKVTKLQFKSYRGAGEFFIMSSENWNRNHIKNMTIENLLEIPPFRIYPVYFKMDKNDIIDLFVEFYPKNSGTHVENIIIACDNGEVRSLDLLGDAIGWHSYFFSFQDDLIKDLPVDSDDDPRVKYYLNFGDTTPIGKVQKSFSIRNNSDMPFEFQWKIRDINALKKGQKYFKLFKYQVQIQPENGTFGSKEICDFNVTIIFENADIGEYRMVLSLYVLNLPYQCIEEDNTIIQPTGLVRNLYSQSLYGEEEFTIPSPELLSLQGTYESLQESIKSYVEYQNRTQSCRKYDFCRTTSTLNTGLCAKPLKKSKTYFHIGDSMEDEDFSCVCRIGNLRTEESNSGSCVSNEKLNENGLRNEVIWDFVDILVDEIELWVEVNPVKVILEPSVIELADFVTINKPLILKQVRIINYSRSPVKCQWLQNVESNTADKPFVKVMCDQMDPINGKDELEEDRDQDVKEKSESDLSVPSEKDNRNCLFELSALTEQICTIKIVVDRPGDFRKNLILSVDNGNLMLHLLVQGTAVAKSFSVSPDVINFKIVKQGTRTSHQYEIRNQCLDSIYMKVNQYDFDFVSEKFVHLKELRKEFFIKKQDSTTGIVHLDARKTGYKYSILEISSFDHNNEILDSQYILFLGEVGVPTLSIVAPRFQNAILAPPGMMHVGKSITATVTLKNKGRVSTVFTWGPSFGCHSRKIKIVVKPESGKIKRREKLPLSVELTPLDEGIIDHCYIPCYFCRSSRPLILSIVGIVEKINVTFEILESSDSLLTKKTEVGPGNTAYRIHWPIKFYDPNLGETYRKEEEVISGRCRCAEVDEEANRSLGNSLMFHQESEIESTGYNGLLLETQRVNISKSKNMTSTPSKPNKFLSNENISQSFSKSSAKKNPEEYSVQKFRSHESLISSLHLVNAKLEFLNVTLASPATRQFIIRNETPINTKFRIVIQNFGKSEKRDSENSIIAIKRKILGSTLKEKKSREAILLEVDPSEGDLLGGEALCINVVASGNTWGEYKDVITCHINGIPSFSLKVFVQLCGHPFYFPMFENYSATKPVLRFQPVSPISEPAVKKIRVVNRSAIPITISWLIFLTQPLSKEEEHEDSINLYLESNANLDSNHSEESTKSVKVYLPKNISESASTFRNMLEMRDFSQNSGTIESFGKGETPSDKIENQDSYDEGDKARAEYTETFPRETNLSESQQFMFRIDIHNFRVDPKEVSFEPYEEKKIMVTFDPRFCKTKNSFQEFRAVLTGCVKLKPSDEKSPGVFFRPTGMNFLSEIMDFNAVVETPTVSFEILKGDLKFYVDANEVIKPSTSKSVTISRNYLFKNKTQSSISLNIEISPGSIFSIAKIETVDQLFDKYNPDLNKLIIKSGQTFEVTLECKVSYKDVSYAYEQLKLNRKKDLASSDDVKMSNATENEEFKDDREPRPKKEPWCQYFANGMMAKANTTAKLSSLEARDSLKINLNRMSSKSNSSICHNYSRGGYYGEMEGEMLIIPNEIESMKKPKVFQHVIIIEEDINIIQPGLMTQTIVAELHLSFPALNIIPKVLDMGNVYIGETALRYCSIINLTGFPTDFKVKSKCNVNEFTAKPLTGNLPSANYNSDVGRSVTVEFTPQQPGYFTEIFQIYCNSSMDFDFYELPVSGIGTWNEKYRKIKFETATHLQGPYSNLQK